MIWDTLIELIQGKKKKVNKMSNEELNAIIAGQTITMMIMFIVFLYILTN